MKIKTITLTGEEQKIEFDKNYAFIEINNLGKSEILVSTKPEIVRGNDDVIIISAKTIATVGDTGSLGIKKIYASGEGEIQLIGKSFAEHCFKLPASGGNSDDPAEVLKFLPHPEGIYAYWDLENNVENFTWTDMINGNVINAINDNSFVIQNDYLSLRNTGDDAEIKVKNFDNLVIYFTIEVDNVSPYPYILYNGETGIINFNSSSGYLVLAYSNATVGNGIINGQLTSKKERTYALINTPKITTGIDSTLSQGSISRQVFVNHIGLYSNRLKFKSILLSDDISNIDYIKENITALQNKYFPE